MKKTIIERGKIRRSRKGKGRKKIDKSDDGKCKKKWKCEMKGKE